VRWFVLPEPTQLAIAKAFDVLSISIEGRPEWRKPGNRTASSPCRADRPAIRADRRVKQSRCPVQDLGDAGPLELRRTLDNAFECKIQEFIGDLL
jgi:hypothetical protein